MLVQRQGSARLEATSVMASVVRSIDICERKLAVLEGVVEVTKQALAKSSRATKTLGSFRLACKKKDIREIEQQLHAAVSSLSLTMMANLTFIHSETGGQLHSQVSATNQTTNMISHELILLRSDLSGKPKGISSVAHAAGRGTANTQTKSPRTRPVKTQSIGYQSYTSIFGKLLIRRASKSPTFSENECQEGSETDDANASTWVFMPSLLSRRFEYQAFNTYGFVQRSLRIYPVIPNNHPIWTMCEDGDLRAIQQLLRTGQVSPYSVDEDGWTLLHNALVDPSIELCRLLFDLGLTGQELDNDGFKPYLGPGASLNDNQLSDLIDIYTLFSSRCNEFDATEFFIIFFRRALFNLTLETFNDILHALALEETIEDFDFGWPLRAAMKNMLTSDPEFRGGWRELIHRLLDFELPNLEAPNRGSQTRTILDQVVDIAESPFDADEVGEEWLGILEDHGLDIETYLRTERIHHQLLEFPIPYAGTIYREEDDQYRYRATIFSENTPRISWDWYVDPEGDAFEVLYEFRHLGPSYHQRRDDYKFPEVSFNWPYVYPFWEFCRAALDGDCVWEAEKSFVQTLLKVRESRFDRRWRKKIKKLERAQGLGKRLKIPGAWVD